MTFILNPFVQFPVEEGGDDAMSLANATSDGNTFSFATQDGNPNGMTLSVDGTKMYMYGNTNKTVYQYTLSTAFDVSSASYASKSKLVSAEIAAGWGLHFKPDGTAMYISDQTSKSIYQYTLSTAWDVSTATYASKSLSSATETTQPRGFALNSDGTKVFVVDRGTDFIYQYSLATAYDMSTASYDSKSFALSTYTASALGMWVDANDARFFLVDTVADDILQFTMSTANDISTTGAEEDSISIGGESTLISVFVNTDKDKMIVSGVSSDTARGYDL